MRREATVVDIASEPREARERFTDGVTRAAVDYGYAEVDVERIAKYAGLPASEFDRHFDSKDQCFLAGFDRFLERMREDIGDACESTENWAEKVELAIRTAFEFVAELEPVARVFVVDAARIGEAALERRHEAIESAARILKHGRLLYPRAAELPDATERTLVAGVVMIASTSVLHEDAGDLPEFVAEATEMVLAPYLGTESARLLAAT